MMGRGTKLSRCIKKRRLRPRDAEALQTFYNGLSDETKRLFAPFGRQMSLELSRKVARNADGSRYDIVLLQHDSIVARLQHALQQ